MTNRSNNNNNNNNNKSQQQIEFRKQLEKKAGTFSDEDCGIGMHVFIEKLNGAVVCYVCGKVLYRSNEDRPKP